MNFRRRKLDLCLAALLCAWMPGWLFAALATPAPKAKRRATPHAASRPRARRASPSTATGKARTASRARTTRARSTRQSRSLSHRQLRARLKPTAERVEEIQQALLKAGYLDEEPNGMWDDRTREAMRRYQAAHGFPTTGRPEAKSLMKLGLGPHALPSDLDPSAQTKTQEPTAANSAAPPGAEEPKKDATPSSPAPPSPQP